MSVRSWLLLLACAAPAAAAAQTPQERPVRRFEVDVGAGLLGGGGLGSTDANLRANMQAEQTYRLFASESRFVRAPQVHLRAAFAFTPALGVEGGMTLSRPDVRSSISGDVEGAPSITSAERIDQYFFDAALVVMLNGLRAGDRLVPFVTVGGGYLRQLHEGQTVIEHGQVYHAGGGIKYWLLARDRGWIRATGLRGDARLHVMQGGVSFEESPRAQVAFSGSMFVTF